MAQSTVKNLMIEMKSFDGDSLRVRLDNPKDNITRAQIAEVMQPAFTNSWIITDKGSTAGYLGETVLETSTKISLEGEDFYVTPNSLNITATSSTPATGTLTITGAQAQGYNFKNANNNFSILKAEISDNGLTVTVTAQTTLSSGSFNVDLILVIRGQEITIPITVVRS